MNSGCRLDFRNPSLLLPPAWLCRAGEGRWERVRGTEKDEDFVWLSGHILGQCRAGGTSSWDVSPVLCLLSTPSPALVLLCHFGFIVTHPRGQEGFVARSGSQG